MMLLLSLLLLSFSSLNVHSFRIQWPVTSINNNQHIVKAIAKDYDSSPASELQLALQRAEQRAMDQFAREKAPVWLSERSSLPFNCTACGKCCKTIGSVYLSPEEVKVAADHLQLTTQEFTKMYASHTLKSQTNDFQSQPWVRLKEKDDHLGYPSCIFLDLETNFCRIYEARPTQCRTYPFWSNIMASVDAWNLECRSRDDDVTSSLPKWSAMDGGCEGMSRLDNSQTVDESQGTCIDEAYRKLYEYTTDERWFPKYPEVPVNSESDTLL
jgi:uncharacterized protein